MSRQVERLVMDWFPILAPTIHNFVLWIAFDKIVTHTHSLTSVDFPQQRDSPVKGRTRSIFFVNVPIASLVDITGNINLGIDN